MSENKRRPDSSFAASGVRSRRSQMRDAEDWLQHVQTLWISTVYAFFILAVRHMNTGNPPGVIVQPEGR